MNVWPSTKIIAAGLTGRAIEVVKLAGMDVRAVRSSYPWIYYLPSRGAICMRCKAVAANPAAPESVGGLSPKATAEWLLAQLLHAFAKKHSKCEELKDAEELEREQERRESKAYWAKYKQKEPTNG